MLIVLGFLLLAGGGYWAWQHPRVTATPAPTADAAALAALQTRLDHLEKSPPPGAPASGPALAALNARLDRLEQRTNAPAKTSDPGPALAALTTRLDALAAAEKTQVTQANSGNADLAARQTAIETRLTSLEQAAAAARTAASQSATAAQQTNTRARLAEAAAALAMGAPLGSLPDAPAALSRFATEAPPTLAALRQSFPAAAQAALAASNPVPNGTPFLRGVWLRAQALVTVRQGGDVVLGNPAAGIIAAARTALAAGDLAGAVAALKPLDAKAGAAMADWRDKAAALVTARAALAAMLSAPPS